MAKISLVVLICSLCFFGCEKTKKPLTLPKGIETVEQIHCGSNVADIKVKIYQQGSSATLFAILLAGSPVTHYFSEQSSSAYELVANLYQRGFVIAEVKYPQRKGFYGACHSQGVENVTNHSGLLYDVVVKKLGINHDDSKHKIVGIGFSIGAALLQAMTYMRGRHIDRVALIGVLVGDVAQGCKSFLEAKRDGYSWREFHSLATALTKNQKGCHAPSEFSAALNFENQPYAEAGVLGIFEGEVIDRSHGITAGNPDQAKYIANKRRELEAPVELYIYPQCGHEILACSPKAVNDVFHFVTDVDANLLQKILRFFGL